MPSPSPTIRASPQEVAGPNRPIRLTQAELAAHPAWRGADSGRMAPPLRGWLAAPLIASNSRNLGLIQLSDKAEGELASEDEAILVQLAQLAAAGIENAQLYEAERAERERAQRIAERLGRLQEVTGALAAATTPEQVAEAAVRYGIAAVGAAAGALGVLAVGGTRILRLAMIGYPREIVEATGDVPIDDVGPIGTVARTGEALWLESGAELLARYPRLAAIPARRNYGATVVVPLALEDARDRDPVAPLRRGPAVRRGGARPDSGNCPSRRRWRWSGRGSTRRRGGKSSRRGALATASQVFAQASLDRERVAEAALRIVAETIGDGGILRLLTEDGEPPRTDRRLSPERGGAGADAEARGGDAARRARGLAGARGAVGHGAAPDRRGVGRAARRDAPGLQPLLRAFRARGDADRAAAGARPRDRHAGALARQGRGGPTPPATRSSCRSWPTGRRWRWRMRASTSGRRRRSGRGTSSCRSPRTSCARR